MRERLSKDGSATCAIVTLVALISSGLWFYWHVSSLQIEIGILKRRVLAAEFGVQGLKESVNDWAVLLNASGFDFVIAERIDETEIVTIDAE
jgi:hypothetical protein